jgi:PAS domain S-box-containing protein
MTQPTLDYAQLYRVLAESAPDAIITIDEHSRVLSVNPAAERIFGYPAAEIVGRPLAMLVPERLRAGHHEGMGRYLATGARRIPWQGVRMPVLTKAGTEIPVEIAFGEFVADGRRVFSGILRDVSERATTERALRMQGFVLESLREGVSVADAAGVIVYANAAEERMFGYGPGELVGRHVSVQNAYPPEENARIVAEVIARLEREGAWEGEWQNVRKDGTPFVTHARITVLELEGRKHWVCVQEDVSARKQAEARKAFLDGVAEALAAPLADERILVALTRYCVPFLADYCSIDVLTEAGEVRRVATAHVDPAKEALVQELWTRYPYRMSDPVGVPEVLRSARPQWTPEFPEAAVVAFARDAEQLRLLRQVGPRSYLCVPLVARGRAFGALTLVYADSGRRYAAADVELADELARRASTAVDNARLYAAEQAARRAAEDARRRATFLAEASARLASSLDYRTTLHTVVQLAVPTLADWCFVEMLEDDGCIRPLAVAHLDPAKVAHAEEVLRRYPVDPAAPFGTALVLRTGEPSLAPVIPPETLDAVARDEEHRRILHAIGFRSHVSVPLTVRGRPVGVLSLVAAESGRTYDHEDLTLALDVAHRASAAIENARLYTEAQAANRAKGDFLATMSHELRTPINATIGYVELLEFGLRGPLTEEQRHDLERIKRSQQHLLGVITNILNFSRIEAGQVGYALADVPVDEVLAEARAMIEPQTRARALDYAQVPAGPTLRVRADREKLRQVLLNLLSNAVKFSAPGGRVDVWADRAGDGVGIHVRDTGVGIPAEKRAAVFEPFVQLDQTLTRTVEGTGLGLAISRDLARGMGGELTVERSAPGEGTTMLLTLPRA